MSKSYQRKPTNVWMLLIGTCAIGGMTWVAAGRSAQATVADQAALSKQAREAKTLASLLKSPIRFEPNRGQMDPKAKFAARGDGYAFMVSGTETVIAARTEPRAHLGKSGGKSGQAEDYALLRMKLVGAKSDPAVKGEVKLASRSNYFLGNDESKWKTDVPNFGKVKCEDVYPGVDVVYYGNQREFEYDFVVEPNADPGKIQLAFEGAASARLDGGDLVLATATGEVRHRKPVIYQEIDGRKQPVGGDYVLFPQKEPGQARVAFNLGDYDRTHTLVIDPAQLLYFTFAGGNQEDKAYGIAHDSSENAYVVGTTMGNFPTLNAYDSVYGISNANAGAMRDIFVSKYDPTGTLLFATYLGGKNLEEAGGIAADSTGCYIVGTTQPVTTAGQGYPLASSIFTHAGVLGYAAVLTKLNSAGNSLVYSTLWGGGNFTYGYGIAVNPDDSNIVWICGKTAATNMPTSTNGYDNTWHTPAVNPSNLYDGYLTKFQFNPGSSSFTYPPPYSTFIGGNKNDQMLGVAVKVESGEEYAFTCGETYSDAGLPIAGNGGAAIQTSLANSTTYSDGWVGRFWSGAGTRAASLIYGTYLGGGSGASASDFATSIGVDGDCNAYVTGRTEATNFPVLNAIQNTHGGGSPNYDAFVSKINPDGTSLVYSTYLGGSGSDWGNGIRVDLVGNAYVIGLTSSSDFYVMGDAIQTALASSYNDMFITKLRPDGSGPNFSTYLGGPLVDQGNGIDVDSNGQAYVCGWTTSTSLNSFVTGATYPSYQPAYGGGTADALVAKFGLNDAPTIVSLTPGNQVLSCEHIGGEEVTFTVEVEDVNADFLRIDWYVDGVLRQTTNVTGPAIIIGQPLPPTQYTDTFTWTYAAAMAAHDVEVRVTDGLATVTGTRTVTITDDASPIFLDDPSATGVLPDVTLDPDNPPLCNQSDVDPTEPAYTDCDASTTLMGVRDDLLPLTDPYPYGTTVITWTAMDSTGNPATVAVQNIIVLDITPPVLTVPGDVVTPADDENGATLDLVELGIESGFGIPLYSATDTCDPDVMIVAFRDNPGLADTGDPSDLAGVYPLGLSVITWIAIDDEINFTVAFQTVYVEGATSVTSAFTSDDEDWTVYGADVTGATHSLVDGNPDGYIYASQPTASSNLWYFEAPSAYHGNKEAAFDQVLSFDLKIDGVADVASDLGVIIVGGGLQIYAPLGSPPTTSWATKALFLNTTGGWKIDDGDGNLGNDVAATDADILTTLGSVTSLKIGGKFRSAAGAQTCLDNPVLNLSYASTP